MIHYYQTNEWELFDLNKDAAEMKSLYNDADYATIRDSLMGQMKELQAKYQDTNPTAPPTKVRSKPVNLGKGKAKGKADG